MSNRNANESGLPRALLEAAAQRLPTWYEAVKKPLPWRDSPSAYHVWVSEIMLQQTRTAAVIPYYERFLAAFPTVAALSRADDGQLMKLWEGLGYYSRARNLKKAAVKVMTNFGGELPRSEKELRSLDGIGPYTAGAIASIAFGEPTPAVDGNVLRVIMRLCACRDDVMAADTRRRVTNALAEVYPSGAKAGALTQALMELGETVCIPNGKPHCLDCPLVEHCLALKNGLSSALPVRLAKKGRRIEKRTVFLLSCDGKYALRKRPDKGLLAGLWELPSILGELDENEAAEAVRALGVSPKSLTPLGQAVHIFTHVEWHMTGYLVECDTLPTQMTAATPHELTASYAIPKAFRAYLAHI